MAIFAKNTEELVAQVIADLLSNTAFSTGAPGAKNRALAEACMKRLARGYQTFDQNILLPFIRHAHDEFLDMIGEILDEPRQQPGRASVAAGVENVKFFVETGTFGDLNEGASIPLTGRVRIGTEPISASTGEGGEYHLSSAVTLSSALSEQYVAVTANFPGSGANVGQYRLKYHDFNGISKYEQLKVINTAPIDNGQETEGDASYRYRLSKKITAAEAANSTALRFAALKVPGVADVVIIPYARGLSTVNLLIKATTPFVSDSLVSAVQSSLESVKGEGTSVLATRPETLGMRFELSLYPRRTLSRIEETDITRQVKQALMQYVNSLDIGEEFIVNEAVQRVMEVSDEIKNMGSATKPFDKIKVVRNLLSRLNATTTPGLSVITGDYATEPDQRLVIDASLDANPITVSWPTSPRG